jgi:hypothetical protein
LNTISERVQALTEILSGLSLTQKQIEKTLKETKLDEEKFSFWDENSILNFSKALRKINKPIMIAANKIDIKEGKENYEIMKTKRQDLKIIPVSAESELVLKKAAEAGLIDYLQGESSYKALKQLSPQQEHALQIINDKVLSIFGTTGVQKALETAVFDVLNYKAIFPAGQNNLKDSSGRILPDCFLLKPDSTVLDFAYFLHTDLGNNFIKAIDVKTKMLLSKEYVTKHRDAIEIIAGK